MRESVRERRRRHAVVVGRLLVLLLAVAAVVWLCVRVSAEVGRGAMRCSGRERVRGAAVVLVRLLG